MNNDCRYLVQGKTSDAVQLEEVSKFLKLVSFTRFMHCCISIVIYSLELRS